MSARWSMALAGAFFLSGCLYHAREETDRKVCDLAAHPFDLQLPASEEPTLPPPRPVTPADAAPAPAPGKKTRAAPAPVVDVQTTALMQADKDSGTPAAGKPHVPDLTIPPEVPGSETPLIKLPREPAEKQRVIAHLYPELPALPVEPTARPGPDGKPYTLAALQQLAAENSPTLRQAASDVEAAVGNLIQARAYPNPTVGYEVDPSNDGSAAGLQGTFVDQPIKTGGKLKLQAAAAEVDLENAQLALRRARSDLATQVRNAYFGVLVAQETVRVTRAVARFTDEVYRIQAGLLGGGFAAPYEPAALRAQAYTARLAYKQAIQSHLYAWKQLVAAAGLRQLPLTEVAGRIDAAIPYFEYDAVLAYVLKNHTDVLTAQNGIDKARYNLKLAQVTPAYPDLDLRVAVLKEFQLPPKQFVHTLQLGLPLPVWDQNKGNVIAAESALVRATEEPHRVEENLTNLLATNYANYKNNLDALEYYRRFILPDQVRYYRGVYERRQVDISASFGDIVAAQQTLAANVTTYLTILGQLWTSVMGVADLLQTDDLFQLATPHTLPGLPDLEHVPGWPCCHGCPPAGCAGSAGQAGSGPESPDGTAPAVLPGGVLNVPVSRRGDEPGQGGVWGAKDGATRVSDGSTLRAGGTVRNGRTVGLAGAAEFAKPGEAAVFSTESSVSSTQR